MSRTMLIPAAGRGSRLGIDGPKILAPIGELTIWSVLRRLASVFADHVHVVLSPSGHDVFCAAAAADPSDGLTVTTSIQDVPRGMGDAIFGCREHWRHAEHLGVMWGDQVGLSVATMRAVREALAPRTLVLPVVSPEDPYVEYRFDDAGRLVHIAQSREGDKTTPFGLSDVGLFGMSTNGLCDAWDAYERTATVGAATQEVNFLPFLVYLSCTAGLEVVRVPVADAEEALGVNTPADLQFHQARLSRLSKEGNES